MTTRPFALISVYNKSGLEVLAKALIEQGYALISTGGSAAYLRQCGLSVLEVSEFTGFPSILDGRVKTLHPKIHGSILLDPDKAEHQSLGEKHGLERIAVVVVNLYPFVEEALNKERPLEEAIEFIDIGGPCLLRAAAKNWRHCLPLIDPSDYEKLMHLWQQGIEPSWELRLELAAKVFQETANYDSQINRYFSAKTMESSQAVWDFKKETQLLSLAKRWDLRYGENPHQMAAFYEINGFSSPMPLSPTLGSGEKPLSYNNIIDLYAACELVTALADQAAVAIVKHTNPCGCAIGDENDIEAAFLKALAGDPKSAFGGIVASNRTIDGKAAEKMAAIFLECIAAPGFSSEALEILAHKKNVRLLSLPWLNKRAERAGISLRSAYHGILVQEKDTFNKAPHQWQTVTRQEPSADEIKDLDFAFKVCAHVKSNAIVYAKAGRVIAIGAGQMSRIDAASFAAYKAQQEGVSLAGTVMASDAFFPFRDCVDLAANLGVAAIIQPGGSKRDQDSIDAANERGLAMVFTGERHFLH